MDSTNSSISTVESHDVVVGVDGSQSALHAVRWAAKEAALHGHRLHIVHADPYYPGDGGFRWRKAARRSRAIVARARQLAHSVQPGITIDTTVVTGPPGRTLVEMSANAKLIVIAARGLDGFAGLELGSVATTVSTYAQCPVVVARRHLDGAAQGTLPVVVGVDDSTNSRDAISFAFDYADRHGLPLTAVHAWRELGGRALREVLLRNAGFDDIEDAEERLLAEAMSGWSELHPDVAVTQVVVQERATEALLGYSPRAELIVVGSRGRSAFTAAVLGSTSQQLVRYASGPVAVMHSRKADRHTAPKPEQAVQPA